MGVKFGREYEDIVGDLTEALGQIKDSYTFLEMNEEDWAQLDETEQKECLKTLADDVFFALGSNPRIEVGSGVLVHEKNKHMIKVDHGENVVTIVKLI